MQVKLFATLAEAAGEKELELDVESGATVADALDRLVEAYPALEADLMTDDGHLQSHVRALVNGDDVFAEGEGYDTVLDADDELGLFPPVSGG
jgi:molybdopterin synthase sulfur carrier subunit